MTKRPPSGGRFVAKQTNPRFLPRWTITMVEVTKHFHFLRIILQMVFGSSVRCAAATRRGTNYVKAFEIGDSCNFVTN